MLKSRAETYAEVYAVIEALGSYYKEKIPEEVLRIFEEKRDKSYKVDYDINDDFDKGKCNMSREAVCIIAWLHLEYWCEDEQEKEKLMELFRKNQRTADRKKETRQMQKKYYLSLWGDPGLYSMGTSVIMADRQIKRGLRDGSIELTEIGNEKAIVSCRHNGKWFMIAGGWGNNQVYTMMLGAICGDVVGSVYEWHNIKYKPDKEHLVQPNARFTDDSVMTCAVAEGLRMGLSLLPESWMEVPDAEETLLSSIRDALQRYGRKYPYAGYGGSFRRWLQSEEPQPYNSWGNGSAMRVSFAGWAANSLAEAEKLGEISAKITHNHPEGLKGAKVVAGCIFLLRNGFGKDDIRTYAKQFYDLDFTLDDIRPDYHFDVSCAGSVPQAIKAFLEGDSFTDVIANAISIGGDSDTIAAIAGSIAEFIYPIPQGLRGRVLDRLDPFLRNTIAEAVDFVYHRLWNL